MGCSSCGSANILRGTLSAHNQPTPRRVRGYSGSGIIKSEQRLAKEQDKLQVAKAMQEAANVPK